MKKLILFASAVVFFVGQMFANPVDVNTAQNLGVKYLKNNVLSAKNITNAEHVYTLSGDNGTPYLYIFNHENGYVVVAADDRAYPILGYSEGGVFDVNNIPDGLRYYLGHYGSQIQYAIDNELVAEEEIAEQWELLRKEGVTMRTRMEKAVNPLLATSWNQDWPYNYYAPSCVNYWTNNHCYAGCVAAAMSQVMKYWNWPETGVGEHSYTHETYGTLSANFGETTYNWSIMPNSCYYDNDATRAVALLMYHCGISVDMNYAADGSGAQTGDVPDALIDYFRYGSCANIKSRDDYTKTAWEDMLIESFDRGLPVVYAGYDPSRGGHAFNCDGYNNQRYFHFNWGWGGDSNDYFQIDALNTGNGNYSTNQRAVFEIMPDYIYAAMPEIQTLQVTVANSLTKTALVSFTVPSVSASGAPLESVDKIEIKRNGAIIQTFNNLQSGEEISFEDTVENYGCYEYSIVGENNNKIGKTYTQSVIFGPNCTWQIICTTTNFQGWSGNRLQIFNSGVLYKEYTMDNSSPLSEKFPMVEGNVELKWYASATEVPTMTIKLKNSAGQQVYSFSGSSTQLSGSLFTGNNDCEGCTPPTELAGQYAYMNELDGTLLTWNCSYTPSKFKIYRSADGVEYSEIAKIDGTLHEYFDGVNEVGHYYYKVTAFSTACESTPGLTPDNDEYVDVEVLTVAENSIDARIYPNPANEKLVIYANDINEVAVYNSIGQRVYHFNGATDVLNISTDALEPGVYMVEVKTINGKATNRIVVMH